MTQDNSMLNGRDDHHPFHDTYIGMQRERDGKWARLSKLERRPLGYSEVMKEKVIDYARLLEFSSQETRNLQYYYNKYILFDIQKTDALALALFSVSGNTREIVDFMQELGHTKVTVRKMNKLRLQHKDKIIIRTPSIAEIITKHFPSDFSFQILNKMMILANHLQETYHWKRTLAATIYYAVMKWETLFSQQQSADLFKVSRVSVCKLYSKFFVKQNYMRFVENV